jgi:hypothetical protein
MDKSNGYEEIADCFVVSRNPEIGAAIVREWSRTLPQRVSVRDLRCGHGEPVARILIENECNVFAVDASLRLLEGSGLGVGPVAPVLNTPSRNYFSGRSDNFDPSGNSGNANNARLDCEGIRLSSDGKRVYISDEYGPYIYEFDRSSDPGPRGRARRIGLRSAAGARVREEGLRENRQGDEPATQVRVFFAVRAGVLRNHPFAKSYCAASRRVVASRAAWQRARSAAVAELLRERLGIVGGDFARERAVASGGRVAIRRRTSATRRSGSHSDGHRVRAGGGPV